MTEEIIAEVVQYDPKAHYLSVVERLASNNDVDVDKLQRIIDMQTKSEDRSAEQCFNADMVKAQADIKVAVKNQANTQTHSKYADLEAVIKAAKPSYTSNGFALSFYEGEPKKDDDIRIMVDVMHRDGHTKTRYHDVPLDTTGIAGKTNKTRIHGRGSSLSYGRRYLTCMIFNIATGDDDDGKSSAPVEYVTGKDLERVNALVSEVVTNKPAFLKVAGIESVDKIPVGKLNGVLAKLNAKKAELAKKAKATAPVDDSIRQPGEDDD